MRNVNRSWWRRLLATLAPASPDLAERLAGHYATEIRLAHDLAQGADSLTRYPHPRVRVLDVAERARESAAHSACARRSGVPGDRAGDEERPTLGDGRRAVARRRLGAQQHE
jgi:hypothetical protein